jgi:flagellin
MMNRLTFAADNATNVSLNSSASRSRILDTDYAQATAEMAKAMILDSAGSAMLTQANQQPMYVLALLS